MRSAPISRRAALGQLGVLLSAGLWPGALRAAGQAGPDVGMVRFAVVNDFHHDSSECDPWFEKLFRSVAAQGELAFVAGLGDLANAGKPESIAAIKRLAAAVPAPFYTVPGNHDNDLEKSTRIYASVLPGRLNYTWGDAGWQFVALDTTDGNKWGDTQVGAATFAWMKSELPKLDPKRPTVVLTHFPLGAGVKMRPLNAEAVLAQFLEFNLRGVFSGHFHGRTQVPFRGVECVTNACCARVRNNHDGTKTKGYFVVTGSREGVLNRTFVEFAG
jgi:hypothetical protein